MKKQKKQKAEWVIVPGSRHNNIIITKLLEQDAGLCFANFTYNGSSKTGYTISLGQYKIIANTILDEPDKFTSVEIYSKDKRGYHLLTSKDYRKITKRGIKKIDPKLQETLKNIKNNSKLKKGRGHAEQSS